MKDKATARQGFMTYIRKATARRCDGFSRPHIPVSIGGSSPSAFRSWVRESL